MIVIVDYDAGNICSVTCALQRLGAEFVLSSDSDVIRSADRVILPGVGNAAAAMASLRERGLADVIRGLRRPVLGICVGMQLMCRRSAEGDTTGLSIFDCDVLRFPTGAEAIAPRRSSPLRGSPPFSGANAPVGQQLPTPAPDLDGTSALALCKQEQCAPATFSGDGTPFAPAARENGAGRDKVPHMGWNRVANLESKLFKGVEEGAHVYFVHSYYAGLGTDTIATCRHAGVMFSAALKYENFYGTQFHPEKSGDIGEQILKNFIAL